MLFVISGRDDMKKIWRVLIIILTYICVMLTLFTYTQNLGLTVTLALPIAIVVILAVGAMFFLGEKEEFDASSKKNGED